MGGESSERDVQAERWLLAFDLDNTLIGDDSALYSLCDALQACDISVALVYNSSRPCASLRETLRKIPQLPTPEFLVGAIGTEIEESFPGRELIEYRDEIKEGWDRVAVAALMSDMGLEAHVAEYQGRFKASYYVWEKDMYALAVKRLREAGIQAKTIYTEGKNLDVIPSRAGKRAAVTFIQRKLDIKDSRVIVAGDSANDLDMFTAPFKGIVVANASDELKRLDSDYVYHAQLPHAGGVLEGLRFWGILK
ncbi:MAG: HAD-IIB family hydrolase [Chloroflexi bacterium]|nr:HAD-IIB family hydrolase [Chloroflexota bacterium]